MSDTARADSGVAAAATLNYSLRPVGNFTLPKRFQLCFPRRSLAPPDTELEPGGERRQRREWLGPPRPPAAAPAWVWPRRSPRLQPRCHGRGGPRSSASPPPPSPPPPGLPGAAPSCQPPPPGEQCGARAGPHLGWGSAERCGAGRPPGPAAASSPPASAAAAAPGCSPHARRGQGLAPARLPPPRPPRGARGSAAPRGGCAGLLRPRLRGTLLSLRGRWGKEGDRQMRDTGAGGDGCSGRVYACAQADAMSPLTKRRSCLPAHGQVRASSSSTSATSRSSGATRPAITSAIKRGQRRRFPWAGFAGAAVGPSPPEIYSIRSSQCGRQACGSSSEVVWGDCDRAMGTGLDLPKSSYSVHKGPLSSLQCETEQ